jgi:uncharacterized lipoprotein YddW (UPF0748 family)
MPSAAPTTRAPGRARRAPRLSWALAALGALAAAALGACDEDAAPEPGAVTPPPAADASAPDSGGPVVPDGGAPDAAAELATVGHRRELRAVWVSTAFRLDFPSATTLTPAQASAELTSIVDVAAAAGQNAIFFQVRAESDALYTSSLEPWSRFLSGTQGVSPGYDPLALLVAAAHAKGVEVHAWMNPYRAAVSASAPTAAGHVSKLYPDAAIAYGGAVTMNPADDRVRSRVLLAVREVTRDYDVDGVVFDDYFYPYPGATPFPDDASYDAYVAGGGALGKSDWRRDNVNRLIAATAAAIRAEKPWVRWGVSPFGIHRPGAPPGVVGLDAYEALACDAPRWLDERWVDYLAPQLYWTSTSAGQPFGKLVDWWASRATVERPIVPAMGLYKLGTSAEWTREEYATQIALTRAASPRTAGAAHFRYASLRDDVAGIQAELAKQYATPARPPIVPGAIGTKVAPPGLARAADGSVVVSHSAPATVRGYAVYRPAGAGWDLARWVPAATASPTTITLAKGRYAISAIDRAGAESLGAIVDVP